MNKLLTTLIALLCVANFGMFAQMNKATKDNIILAQVVNDFEKSRVLDRQQLHDLQSSLDYVRETVAMSLRTLDEIVKRQRSGQLTF